MEPTRIPDLYQKKVGELNVNLGDHEKIKRFRIVSDERIAPFKYQT